MIRIYIALVSGLIFMGTSLTAWADEEVALVGSLNAAEYASDGQVTAVSIDDEERGSVLVSSTGKGKELIALVGESVKISGILMETPDEADFEHVVDVVSFERDEADSGD